jgi:putative transcriptional regulator
VKLNCGLSELLKKNNKTLYWLQKETKISYKTLNHYEKNRAKKFDSDVLAKICNALNCGISDILILTKEL